MLCVTFRSKGGLFAWNLVGHHHNLILIEGLFDLAVLWQAGFLHTSCAFGLHLTQTQIAQWSDRPDRTVFIAFDSDPAGRNAAWRSGATTPPYPSEREDGQSA
jgi:DNA primase